MQNDKSSQSNFPSPSHNTPSPADLQGLFVAAVSAHQASRYDEAEQLYGRVRALRPDNVNLLCNLGLLYRDMGRPSQALARLQEAHALAPDNFAVNLNIGALFEEQGELDQAVIAYRAAQELAPHDPRVMNNLGKALYQQGDRPGALDYLNRAVALAPDYAMAHNNLGVLLNSLGRLEEAIACFRKALAHDEQNCDILYNLAGALSLVGGNDEARTCYEKLLDIEPRHAAARHMLAALSGMATAKAPAAYVVDTFDRYAGHFDNQLTEQLGYRVPELLGRAVAQTMGDAPFRHCLDLGCGTGLSGLAFKDLAVQMSGVDLSPRMLAQARAKAIYDTLHQEDVVTFLERERALLISLWPRMSLSISATCGLFLRRCGVGPPQRPVSPFPLRPLMRTERAPQIISCVRPAAMPTPWPMSSAWPSRAALAWWIVNPARFVRSRAAG